MLSKKYEMELMLINWRKEASYKRLPQEEIKKIYDSLISKNAKILSNKWKRKEFVKNSFFLEKKNGYRTIYNCDGSGKYNVYFTNEIDDTKNIAEVTGTKAVSLFIEKFNEINGLNRKGFSQTFGTSEAEFKFCVPKQFYFKNLHYLDRVIKNVSAVDFCAHYPSCSLGDLPNANTAVKIKGIVNPSEKYPFAFYPVSGHCAEFKKFNTRAWHFSDFAPFLFTEEDLNKVEIDGEYTILMKRADKTFDKTLDFFYNKRKDCEIYKTVMNATIGMFHTKSYTEYKYAHIASIALSRANDKILRLANKIGLPNILQICVDGIIYKGKIEFGEKEKGLGKLYQEFTGKEIKARNINCYIVKDDDGKILKYKHGAFNLTKNDELISEENVKNYEDMYGWKKSTPLEGW